MTLHANNWLLHTIIHFFVPRSVDSLSNLVLNAGFKDTVCSRNYFRVSAVIVEEWYACYGGVLSITKPHDKKYCAWLQKLVVYDSLHKKHLKELFWPNNPTVYVSIGRAINPYFRYLLLIVKISSLLAQQQMFCYLFINNNIILLIYFSNNFNTVVSVLGSLKIVKMRGELNQVTTSLAPGSVYLLKTSARTKISGVNFLFWLVNKSIYEPERNLNVQSSTHSSSFTNAILMPQPFRDSRQIFWVN